MSTTPEYDVLAAVPRGCLIDGVWRPAATTFEVHDPATGEPLARVADATPAEAAEALDAACRAQPGWAAIPPRPRAEILRRSYDLLLARAEEFALLITLEMGKPLAESRGEVAYAADFLLWFSEQAVRIGGENRLAPDGASRLLTTRQPVGPCLLVTPWNFPLAMMTRKVAPALAAGCTALLKPAEETPLSCLLFAQVLLDAGLPAGVVNLLPTSRPAELVTALLADPRLRKLSFTGSTEVGRSLAATAGDRLLRSSMELGGNAPFLVFEDADLDAAIAGAMLAKLRNGGQSCVAANRFLVHQDLAEEFTARLATAMSQIRLAQGTDPRAQLGPVINQQQRERITALVSDAVSRGARIVTGGSEQSGPGWFYQPTVVADLPEDALMANQEIFGPVAQIHRIKDETDAIRQANATDAGLVGYLYTRDLARAFRVSDALDCGMVGVNRGLVSNAAAPFGGVKASGLGREGGFEGIDEYLSVKYLAVDLA
ncbi:NAD-dependent succinate-semialdehyde dehydrogenase [Streptomyces sp. NPDC004069]|uniref:NAD-dependent succinate-semialdehyde dehydrogenase n=1 Tax=Streptomyces sp. NPDC052043 TaxID=3365684 RepID=UPI0037CE61BE